jgi:hypothetical protein
MVQGLLKFEQFYQGNLNKFKTKYFRENGAFQYFGNIEKPLMREISWR